MTNEIIKNHKSLRKIDDRIDWERTSTRSILNCNWSASISLFQKQTATISYINLIRMKI